MVFFKHDNNIEPCAKCITGISFGVMTVCAEVLALAAMSLCAEFCAQCGIVHSGVYAECRQTG